MLRTLITTCLARAGAQILYGSAGARGVQRLHADDENAPPKNKKFDEDFVNKAEVAAKKLIDDGGKFKNFFKVGDEVLLLPEVMSKLDIKPRDHAKSGDLAGENAVRQASHWGRLYVEGWPQPIQYLRGHFGEPPPTGHKMPIFLADPYDACTPLNNMDDIKKHSPVMVIAGRGNCTFGTKANMTELSTIGTPEVPSLVLVNNEPGAIHAPGPDAHDARVFVSMLPMHDGAQLVAQLGAPTRRKTSGSVARGSFVAMNCVEHSETRKNLGQLCDMATTRDATLVEAQVDGGLVRISPGEDEAHEYLLALFGVDFGEELSGPVVIPRDSAFGCSPMVAAREQFPSGAVVVVHRGGGCQFLQKAQHAEAAGARAVVIANALEDDILVRPSCDPRWKGLGVNITVLLVSRAAGEALRAAKSATFTARGGGHDKAWRDLLEPLAQVDAWPRSAEARARKRDAVAATVDAPSWPDRAAWLHRAFARADKPLAAHEQREQQQPPPQPQPPRDL